MKLSTRQYLDCCSNHITKKDGINLLHASNGVISVPFSVYKKDLGFIVMVATLENEDSLEFFSDEFKHIYNICLDNNIDIIVFDPDAKPSDVFREVMV